MKVNYHLLPESIVVNFEGKTILINKNDDRYQKVLVAIKEDKLDTIPELVDNESKFKQFGVEVINGNIFIDDKEVPNIIERKILLFMENDLPYKPLVEFTRKLRQNPSFNSREMLYTFLEHNGHPITEDGNFIAYRGVTSDFKDQHTRSFDNSVGAVCEMDRNQVDDNPNNTCSSGLHVAAYEYAKSFSAQMIEVEVNPMDVVSVPVDYNGTKMRVCKFKVVNICENILNDGLYGHDNKKVNHEITLEVGDFVKLKKEMYNEDGDYFGNEEELEIVDIYGDLSLVTDEFGDTLEVALNDIELF